MSDPHREKIAAGLADAFRAIESDGGATYHYSVDAVARVIDFEGAFLDTSRTHLLFLRTDGGPEGEGATTRVDGFARFEVLIVRKDTRATADPFEEAKQADPIAATVLEYCVSDVTTCLFRNLTLTVDGESLAWNVMHGETDTDFKQRAAGWLTALFSFTVRYDYARP